MLSVAQYVSCGVVGCDVIWCDVVSCVMVTKTRQSLEGVLCGGGAAAAAAGEECGRAEEEQPLECECVMVRSGRVGLVCPLERGASAAKQSSRPKKNNCSVSVFHTMHVTKLYFFSSVEETQYSCFFPVSRTPRLFFLLLFFSAKDMQEATGKVQVVYVRTAWRAGSAGRRSETIRDETTQRR